MLHVRPYLYTPTLLIHDFLNMHTPDSVSRQLPQLEGGKINRVCEITLSYKGLQNVQDLILDHSTLILVKKGCPRKQKVERYDTHILDIQYTFYMHPY